MAEERGSNKSKCITGLWDLYIPSDLLQEILSRLGLKSNIEASTICKAWCEAAVSVRKLKRRPWLFYRIEESSCNDGLSTYILVDPSQSQSQTYKVNLPVKKDHVISYYKDGWVLVRKFNHSFAFLLNPFTNEHLYLPKRSHSYNPYFLAFSAAPTSTSCVVISYTEFYRDVVIDTWRPGESAWTSHRFETTLKNHSWGRCVFVNGMFYCLGKTGELGVFDPCEATWNLLPVKPCPVFTPPSLLKPLLMTEHEGDIFVIYTIDTSNPTVFKLNLKQSVWEEQRDLGGVTVFASFPGTVITSGLSAEERNRIYPSFSHSSFSRKYGTYYYSLDDGKRSSYPPPRSYVTNNAAWVEPPHNNVNFS